jgi:DNA-binding beta-propeller fold protein YncE
MRSTRRTVTAAISAELFRPLLLTILAVLGAAAFGSAQSRLTGGAGTIYVGAYSKRIIAIDEGTERPSAEIQMTTGIPEALLLSADGKAFYVANADLEHIEVVDLATRKVVDAFTLSEGNKKVRIMAYAPDPQLRVMTLITTTTTKLVDRFEIGSPTLIRYDLNGHKAIRTAPWSTDPEPGFYSLLKYSPDGKLLYAFGDEIVILDSETLQPVGVWNLSLRVEPGLGRFDVGWLEDANDDPGYVSGVFTMEDRVQHRRLLVVGRINLNERDLDFFPLGPAPEHGRLRFALGLDRAHGYILLSDIGHHEFWTIDIPGRRLLKKLEFKGRPRMEIKASSNGKLIYILGAGNTIDLYNASDFVYLRTITLDTDMTSFSVIPRQGSQAPGAVRR